MENTIEVMERIGQELGLYMEITSKLHLHSCKNFQLLASQLEAIKRQVEGDGQTYNAQFINYLLQVTAKHYAEIAEITHEFLLANLTCDPNRFCLASGEVRIDGEEGTGNGRFDHSTTSRTIQHAA